MNFIPGRSVCYPRPMPRLLDALYAAALLLALPWLVWRRLIQRKVRTGWVEKLTGRVPERTGEEPCVWWHAVSVGEALQLPKLIAAVSARRPGVRHVVTVSTGTGLAVAREKLPGVAVHQAPMDFSWAVEQFLARVRPDAAVRIELELWPNLVRACTEAGVPVAVVNGRLSENSFRGYRRIERLVRPMFARLAWVGAQSDAYALRFTALGADPTRVRVAGSVKFDGVETDPHNARTAALGRALGLLPGEPVLLCGSTGDPEETAALDAHAALLPRFPALRLLIAPRHAERFDAVAALVRGRGLNCVRYSETSTSGQASGGRQPSVRSPVPQARRADAHRSPILLLDTLGDLSAAWGLATVAFVGGSLNGRGGQNMIEPAAYGAPVLVGPNTRNFADVVARLTDADALTVVHDAEDLAAAAGRFLADPAARDAAGERGRRLVRASRGATAQTAAAVCTLLPTPTAVRRAA